MIPCPICDLVTMKANPIAAFAWGIALGCAFSDMHSVTDRICPDHRTAYVMAMVDASVGINTVDEEPGTPGEEPR